MPLVALAFVPDICGGYWKSRAADVAATQSYVVGRTTPQLSQEGSTPSLGLISPAD